MKKTRIVLANSILLFIMFIAFACSCENTRKHLLNDFWSRMSKSEVISMTHLNQYNWKETFNKTYTSRDSASTYHEEWIEVNDYTDLGILGKLKLEFYNNKLMITFFCTKNIDKYLSSLEAIRGVKPIGIWENESCNGIRISRGKGADNIECISWGDEHLINEADAWINRND